MRNNLPGPDCVTTMTPCGDCIYIPSEHQLNASEVAQQCGILAMRLDLEAERKRSERMAHDSVTGFLTNKGLEAMIDFDESLQRDLLQDTWGIAWVDVRGLKYVNDEASEKAGDVLLNLTATQISETLMLNTRARKMGPLNINEQRKDPEVVDIQCRYTGDEFLVLFRDITPYELAEVAENRLQPLFSVAHAIVSTETPVIASLSFAHSLEVDTQAATPREAFDAVLDLAQTKHHGEDGKSGLKKAQYDEMWQWLTDFAPSQRANLDIPDARPSDDRKIVDTFYKIYRPDYLDTLSVATRQ